VTGPQYNALLAARYADAITRQFGEEVRVDTITPELGMVVVLENDRPENAFLRAELLYAQSLQQVLSAANNSGIQLRNPATSNLIATVTAIVMSETVGGELVVSASPTQLTDLAGAAVQGKARDTRNDTNTPGLLATSRCVVSRDNTVGNFSNQLEQVILLASSPWSAQCAVPIILAPGGAVRVVTSGINTTLDISFAWRERVALPGELQ